MAQKRMPPAGRAPRTPGATRPPLQTGMLNQPTADSRRGRADAVHPSQPQYGETVKPTPQGGPGS